MYCGKLIPNSEFATKHMPSKAIYVHVLYFNQPVENEKENFKSCCLSGVGCLPISISPVPYSWQFVSQYAMLQSAAWTHTRKVLECIHDILYFGASYRQSAATLGSTPDFEPSLPSFCCITNINSSAAIRVDNLKCILSRQIATQQ